MLLSINPATGKVIARHRPDSPRQIEDTLAATHRAFLGWRELAPSHRARHLRALGKTLLAQRDALAALINDEMGKSLDEARAEIEKCADCCAFYAKHGASFLRDERPPHAPREALVVCEPLGVILAIMPWNDPFWQAFRAAVPALSAGNTVLLKHASTVTGCALAIERLFTDAGAPAGLLRTIVATGAQASKLIADPRVRGVTLTGSTEAGRKVAALAGAALKPCVLELGGGDPYLVFHDADLDLAADVCAAARLVNAGQSCVAAKRFIVVESVRAAFEKKLAARMAAHPAFAPLARADLRDDLHAQVTRSLRRGARLHLGGKLPASPGFYYPATVLADVRPGMPAFDEELFGPVAAIVAAPDEAAALDLANQTPFGLGAAIFSRDKRRALDLARERLDAGMVFVNASVRSHVALPFGGTKASGLGRELAAPGARSFVNLKTLWLA